MMVCYKDLEETEVASKYVKLDNQNLAVKRPSPSELSASQPVTKKRNPKVAEVNDPAGNWVPLDEYYYGTHDGDASYTEEKGEYRFKCWYCSKMLYNNVRAMQHIQGHIDASKQQNIDLSDLTQCKHCYKQFDTPFEMQTHVEKVHLSNKVLMCRICEKDFSTPRELTVHMKGHHHACEMPYVCHLCNFRSSMYSDVVDHFKKKHDSSHYMLCLYCLRTFEVKFVSQGWGQTQTYYGHLLKHQTKSATKKCVVCRLTFFNALDVKNHRKNCHMGHFKDVKALSSGGKADSGQRQKKGSNLKSLNAPSVSRIQDYGEIIFPAEASNTKCVECKMMMSSIDHYKKYVHCSMCRFATSCSVAYANHMMGFHSGQMSSLNLNIPWERPMREVMYCACGFNSKYGNKIANHLVYCAKWTCYSTKRTQSDTTPGRTGDEKKEGSILGMLGLVQKSTVATKIRSKQKLGTKSGIKVEGIEVKATKKYPGDLKSERKPVTEERSEKLHEKEPKEIIDIENEPVRETARPKKQNERPKEIIDIENEPVRETTRPEKQDERPTDIAYKSNVLDKSDKVAEDGEKEKLEQKTDITEIDQRDATSENLENKDGKELVSPEVVSEAAKPSEDEQPETDTKTEQDKSSSEAENEQEVTKDMEEIMDTETVDEPDETTEDSQTEMDAETTKSEDKIEPAEIDDNTSIKDEAVDTDTKETHTQGNLKPEHSKDASEDVRDSEPLNETVDDKEIVHEMDTLDEVVESPKANLEKEDENSLKEASDVKQFEPGETGLDSELEETAETIESIENEKELLEPTTENTEESEEPPMEMGEKSDDQTSQENEPTEQSKEKQDLSDSSENKKDEPKEDEKPEEDIEPKEEEKPKETERSSQKESSDHGDSRRSVERKSSSDHRDSTDRRSQERGTSSDHRDSSDRRSQEKHTSSDHRDSSERHSRDRYDSGDRHHSGSSDRSRHDDRSRQDDRHRQDNRSYGSNRSDNYHGNRSSYDQNRDRDRSYDRDRDRDRDRDYNRNRDYRHGDNRSGHGYQDNRGQSYGSGGQGYRGSQGQYGGYQGNRGDHYQDRNRGGHHQDRNYNRNYQNRGGYNQNYRGGYRGGYY